MEQVQRQFQYEGNKSQDVSQNSKHDLFWVRLWDEKCLFELHREGRRRHHRRQERGEAGKGQGGDSGQGMSDPK